MSDFLNKLKGIFIVQEPAAEQKQTSTAAPVKNDSPAKSTPNTAAPIVNGNVSEKFYEILFNSMEANNQTGFDYLEFKKSIQTLAKMPMDESTRYNSAFAAAQAMGVTAPQLTDSAQFYLKVLHNEDAKFQESVNLQRQKQIGNKEKAIQDLDATIKAKNDQIAKLTQEISLHQEDMSKMKAEISDAVLKIETTLSDFKATYTDLTQQISVDVENMKKYLK